VSDDEDDADLPGERKRLKKKSQGRNPMNEMELEMS